MAGVIDQAELTATATTREDEDVITADSLYAYLEQRGDDVGNSAEREAVAERLNGLIDATRQAQDLHRALAQQTVRIVDFYWRASMGQDALLVAPGDPGPVGEALANFRDRFQMALQHLSTSQHELEVAVRAIDGVKLAIDASGVIIPEPNVADENVAFRRVFEADDEPSIAI